MSGSVLDIQAGLNAAAADGEETAEIYRREARAVYARDRESAASFLLDAAYANDHDDAPEATVLRDLDLAMAAAPDCAWVYGAAHRLLLKLGLWKKALDCIEREYALEEESDSRLALCLTAADLYWIVGEDASSAIEWIDRALEAEPTNVAALYLGLWVRLSQKDASSVLSGEVHAEALAKILGAPGARSVLYGLAGSIQAANGNDLGAFENYGESAQSDRGNIYAWLRYALLCEKFARLPEAAQAYAQAAQIVSDDELSGAFYRRAGMINGFIGQHERESYYLSEAYRRSADKYGLAVSAADAFAMTGNYQRVSEYEHQLIEMSADDAARAAHRLLTADICDEAFHVEDETIAALESACEDGGGAVADARLAALYEARGDFENLARILAQMAEADAWSAPCLTWLRGIASWRAGAKETAIDIFAANSERLGLLRLDLAYEDVGDDEGHVRMLDGWYRATRDVPTRQALKSQIVTILTERLQSPEIAIQYMRDPEPTVPSRDLAWRRFHIYAALAQYDEIAASLLRFAGETLDEDEALMWRMEAALVRYIDLKDFDGCADILSAIHHDAPAYVPAIVLLHHIAMCARRYDLVIQANVWRDEFQMPADRRAAAACENAWASLRLGDENAASMWFEQARRLGSFDPYYLRLYMRLLKRQEKWDDIAGLIGEISRTGMTGGSCAAEEIRTEENEIVVPEDIEESEDTGELSKKAQELRALLVYKLEIETYCLRREKGTVRLLEKRFDEHPCIYGLTSYIMEKLVREPAEQLLAALGPMRGRLGTVSEEVHALLDWVQAAVLRHSPSCDPKTSANILVLLKRSLAMPYGNCLRAEVLRALREVPNEDVVTWLERYAAVTPDKWYNQALNHEAAVRAVWSENNYDNARRALPESLVREASDRRTLWMLEHFSAVSEDWQALGFFRERLAALEVSTPARVQTLKSALSPYVDDDQTSYAVRVAQECIKYDAHAFPALVTLAHVAEDGGDAYSLACIADRLSEASQDADNRMSYGIWAAQLWSKALDKPDQAVSSLARILAHDPACLSAIGMSEQLLGAMGRYEQLGRIYTHAVSALPDGRVQIDILRKYARLLAHELNDVPSATLSLARIIAQSPGDAEALRMQSDLLIEQSRWTEAVEVLEQLSKSVESPDLRRSTHLKLADILIHQLEQPEQARRILRRHLNQFPHDMAALQLLYDIACAERNWGDAKSTLEEICEADDAEDEVRRARMAFTRIAREAGWPHDMRTLYEREAIAAVIDYRADFDALVEDYRAHHEIPRLIDVAKRELSKQGNAERIAQYRGCVAALYVANGQHREALGFLSEIIHESQHTDWAYLARAQALASAGQLDSAIGEFRRTLKRNIGLNDAFEPFVDVLKQTGDGISLSAVESVRDVRLGTPQMPPWGRCTKGSPRGFFDFELISIPRAFADAQRYLRMMTPYAFEMFSDGLQAVLLPQTHWTLARCQQLFGQNLDIRQIYAARGLKGTMCRVRFDEPDALVFDESLIGEENSVEFDYWAAYAMHQAVTGGCLLDLLDDDNVTALFSALCQPKPDTALAQTMKKQLFKALPRSDRKLFKDGVPFLMPSWPDFRRALQTRAASLGAVMSACPACALYCRPKDEALETFLISDNYARFVKMFWTHPD